MAGNWQDKIPRIDSMETYNPPENVNLAFKQLCAILFGEEVGALADFGDYLKEAMMPYTIAKSSFSGKPVFLSNPYYPANARFSTQDE
ncbi:MAG TPA: hypothetical protein PLO51_04840, partial [Candidatus Micrarchaeota archaeon]|nr:hypothetical protein [Candidatus Micrarchaeota archaeon]